MMILFQVLPVIIIQLWMDALILPLELSGIIQCAPDVTSCQPEKISESLLVYAEGQPLNKFDESLIESPVSAVNPCKRHGQMHDACMVHYVDLVQPRKTPPS